MANVSSATKFFPTAKEGFTTTTSGSVSPGASSVGLASVSGLTNGDVMVFVIDPTDATKKQVFTGTIDTGGSQVTNVVWTEGTNVAHSSGATVVDYETATHWALYSAGLSVQHNQTGTHKNITNTGGMTNSGGLTTDTLTVSSGTTLPAGDIGSADIADGAVKGNHLKFGNIVQYAQGLTQSPIPTTEADISGSSLTVTPTVASTAIITYGGQFQLNTSATRNAQLKLYVDGSNVDYAYVQDNPGAVETHLDMQRTYIVSLTAASHTIKLGGIANTSSTLAFNNGFIYVILYAS